MKSLASYVKGEQHIFIIIKPGFLEKSKDIIEKFEREGWKISKMKTKTLLFSEAKRLYAVHKKEDFYTPLCHYMSSGPSTAIVFSKDAPATDKVFKKVASLKDEIRKQYGESDMRNVMHSSDSAEAMEHEMGIYF